MLKKCADATAVIGEYETKAGERKRRYHRVGTLFKDDEKGYMTLKLDAVPIGGNFSGWISFFKPRSSDDANQTEGSYTTEPTHKQSSQAAEPVTEINVDEPIDLSDIPF